MAHKKDKIKADQGSIKVGTTGKVSTLMTRELDYIKHSSSNSVSHKRNTQSILVSVYCGDSKRGASSNSASTTNSIDQRMLGSIQQKMYTTSDTGCEIPMLGTEDVLIEQKPVRCKREKRRAQLVEIVDLNCGTSPKKAWSNGTTNKGKVTFSRLSVSNSSFINFPQPFRFYKLMRVLLKSNYIGYCHELRSCV